MAAEAAKTVREGDPEVSEAIDFARYYAHRRRSRPATAPYGVVVVASPWNFPYAIPAGGVLAALMAGNTVILKPPPETRQTAWLLANQCWRAGIPRDVLQFVACPDDEVGRRLITHDDVATVVLTGSYATAQLFLGWKPQLRLLAETSGKNAIVVTEAADVDAAIRDVVRSAFGHAGQKCSAASLLILTAPVYDDDEFLPRLAAAVRSVRVGEADDPATMMAPLIAPPSGSAAARPDGARRGRALARRAARAAGLARRAKPAKAITSRRWTPGVRVGVAEGSWFHQTECFGPVLGVMRADDLAHAVRLQNGTPFGLTGGIQSLDDDEIGYWLDHVEVGNAYVNRHITGAIVQRQPFGGWKRSSIGGAPKAGGPHYVHALLRPVAAPVDVERGDRQLPSGVGPSTSPPATTPRDCAASRTCCVTCRWPASSSASATTRPAAPCDAATRRGTAVRRRRHRLRRRRRVRRRSSPPVSARSARRGCAPSPTIGDELAAACHALDIAVDRVTGERRRRCSSCRTGCASRRSARRCTATADPPQIGELASDSARGLTNAEHWITSGRTLDSRRRRRRRRCSRYGRSRRRRA